MHLSDTQAVRVAFGCETRETGEIFHQAADGLMGLGGSDVSIPHQLAKSGAIEPVFSLCFGDTQGSGALMIGNVPLPSELRWDVSPRAAQQPIPSSTRCQPRVPLAAVPC